MENFLSASPALFLVKAIYPIREMPRAQRGLPYFWLKEYTIPPNILKPNTSY